MYWRDYDNAVQIATIWSGGQVRDLAQVEVAKALLAANAALREFKKYEHIVRNECPAVSHAYDMTEELLGK